MKRYSLGVVFLTALSLVPATLTGLAPQAPSGAPPLAITHVAVIDTVTGSIQRDMNVLVRDARVTSVQPGSAPLPPGAEQFDGRGRFAIPGLWDMHVHLSWATSSALPAFVATGVTGVRDLGSDFEEIGAFRTKIDAGLIDGPQIFRAGPMLNGQSFNQWQLVTTNPQQARGIVRALKQGGVDFIKVHRRVPRDDYFAIVEEAKAQGLAVVGHIPMTVTPEEASDAGQLIEHTDTLFEGTLSGGLAQRQLPNADVIRKFRANGAEALFARFVKNGTPLTPTLIPWRAIVGAQEGAPPDPRLRYVARSLRATVAKAPPLPPQVRQIIAENYAEYREVVRMMARAGVTLVAGTDTSTAPAVPGYFLHDELMALVDAGVTPLQALQAATVNAARIMKKDDRWGTIAAGKQADLVLLDGNPLDDIRNTQRIAGVVLRGKLLRRPDLDRLLKSAEELANRN